MGKTTEYDDVPAFVPYRADGGYLRKRNSRISFESFSVFDADTVLYEDVKMQKLGKTVRQQEIVS